MSSTPKSLPELTNEQLSDTAKKAVQAAERAAKKLREQKRKLGQKLVIYKEGKVITVDA